MSERSQTAPGSADTSVLGRACIESLWVWSVPTGKGWCELAPVAERSDVAVMNVAVIM
ncbi:MAG: hypothetical protein K2K95_05135 [Muribaculaceae bacterium]|nr:hypothetical protein [Muribaculaceae bacterium]